MNHSTCHYRGKFLSLRERDNWEYAERVNSEGVVVIIATTGSNDLVLVEQFRIPVNADVIELPAGLMGDMARFKSESVFSAASRELLEETGFRADHWEMQLECPASAGMSSEILTIVRARGLHRIGPGGGDKSENIRVHLVSLDTIDNWLQTQISAGKKLDAKIYAALYWLSKDNSKDQVNRK